MGEQNADVQLFLAYQEALARREGLRAPNDMPIDSRIQEAFSEGVSRLDERIQGYEGQPARLAEGAIGAGENAAAAVGQIARLEGVLDDTELEELREPYLRTLVGAIGYLAGRKEVNDPRVDRLLAAAQTLGGVVLEEEMETKPKLGLPAPEPTVPEAQPGREAKPEAEEPEVLAMLAYVAHIPEGQREEYRPGALFELVYGRKYNSRNYADHSAFRSLARRLGSYPSLEPGLQAAEYNGVSGKGARYTLRPIAQETLTKAFERVLPTEDALTLATFFKLYSDALHYKNIPVLRGEVLDSLLDAVPETLAEPRDRAAITDSRVRALETLKKLLATPQLVERLDGLVSEDDPRYGLLNYIQEIAGEENVAVLDKLATSYKEIIVTVAMDKKMGGVAVQGATAEFNGEDGSVEPGTAQGDRQHTAVDIRRVAVDEQADSAGVRAQLNEYVSGLAGMARRYNLKLDRPYSPQRLKGIFEDLKPLLGGRTASLTMAEAVVLMASTTDVARNQLDPDHADAYIGRILQQQMRQ